MKIAPYNCAEGCCEVSVRIGKRLNTFGAETRRPLLVTLNDVELQSSEWARKFRCSRGRMNHRLRNGFCLRAERIPNAHVGTPRGGNCVGLDANEAANAFLRLSRAD